jgi:signal transduction histidine kinase/CheY-like chemotaxis protein/NAD-dependent dihydropyrimidine dehydrogenase PreA subunit
MKKIVGSNQDRCVGCNRCTRACPIETANVTYQDEFFNIKVKVDNTQCIACGACIAVCKHDARFYLDDLDRFFADLAAGLPVSLMAAPSLKTNFPHWKRLLGFFRSLGVGRIYDVSLGADICIWAHLRYLERYKPKSLITQPCPVIVSYCEIHRPALLPYLSPIRSPMGCAAVFIREYQGVRGPIAALSPCIGKTNEFEAAGLIDYNITFAKLQEYLEKNGISLPETEGDFDPYPSGLGALFPAPGGLAENLRFFLGGSLRIDVAEGPAVYQALDDYLQSPEEDLPSVFDVLNCAGGCNLGSGTARDKTLFRIRTVMDKTRRELTGQTGFEDYQRGLFRNYDTLLDLSRFLRAYTPAAAARAEISEADIREAFKLLEKDTYAKQNFNCGACGSESCRDMARKIALKINIPINCIIKSRDDLWEEHRLNIDLYKRNAAYIGLIHRIGEDLIAVNEDDFSGIITQALWSICSTLNGSGVHLWINKEWESFTGGPVRCKRLFGWPKEEETGTGMVDDALLPGWIQELLAGKTINRRLKTMSPREQIVFRRGKIQSVLAVPVFIKGGFWGFISVSDREDREFSEEEISVIAACAILVVSNILEKKMTESLVVAREAALAGTRAKSEFLSRMSHEIRTPMNAIIGMTKIAGNTGDIQKLRSCLSTINSSSTQLLGLINDVLDMSKIEAGKFELDTVPFDLAGTVEKIRGIMAEQVSGKDQILEIRVASARTRFEGDELRLSQVITNLLANAVKFTPAKGRITLGVEDAGTAEGMSRLRFSVTDTGIGMSGDQLSRLFAPYEQAGKNITQRFGGTGLGLAISKTIVEKMGGDIWAESEPGRGSAFVFEVNLRHGSGGDASGDAGGEAAPAAMPPASETPDFSGISLLLAEDIEINREIFIGLLEDTGMAIDTAADGLEALEKFRDNSGKYDLIVMDIQMPRMNGFEATRAIRSLGTPKAAAVPIIAMTANAFKEDIAQCLACGMNDHLAKPIDLHAVREKIARFTRGRSA